MLQKVHSWYPCTLCTEAVLLWGVCSGIVVSSVVAGYDTAPYGLPAPADQCVVLAALRGNMSAGLVATTKLSNLVTARCGPSYAEHCCQFHTVVLKSTFDIPQSSTPAAAPSSPVIFQHELTNAVTE
jgi:hypothetical protein